LGVQMSAKSDEQELEDAFTPPPRPRELVVDEGERVDDGWNRRASKFRIAEGRSVLRGTPDGPKVLGAGYECPDCRAAGRPGRRDHQFHLAASRAVKGGPMLGPEAAWYELALADGLVAGSPQAETWNQDLALRMAVLGVAPERKCRNPNCGRDLTLPDGSFAQVCRVDQGGCGWRNGFPELRPPSTAQVARIWERDTRGGLEGALNREKELTRSEQKDLLDKWDKLSQKQMEAAAAMAEKQAEKQAEAIALGVERGFEKAMTKLSNEPSKAEK
jgi:hypothetical protein